MSIHTTRHDTTLQGKLIEWGLSEDAAAAAMADVQTIPMDSRSRPPADLSTVADVLRRYVVAF